MINKNNQILNNIKNNNINNSTKINNYDNILNMLNTSLELDIYEKFVECINLYENAKIIEDNKFNSNSNNNNNSNSTNKFDNFNNFNYFFKSLIDTNNYNPYDLLKISEFKKEKQIIDKKLNKIKKMYSYIESKNNTYNKIQNKLLSKNNTFSFNTKNQFIKKIALKKSLKYYKKIKQYKNNINFIFSYIFLICGVEVVTNINKMKNFNKNNNSNLFNILKFKYSVPFNDQNELLNKYELKNLDKYFKSYKIIQTMNDCVGFTLNCNTIICAINNNIKNNNETNNEINNNIVNETINSNINNITISDINNITNSNINNILNDFYKKYNINLLNYSFIKLLSSTEILQNIKSLFSFDLFCSYRKIFNTKIQIYCGMSFDKFYKLVKKEFKEFKNERTKQYK